MLVRVALLFCVLAFVAGVSAPTRAKAEIQSFDCRPGDVLVGFKARTGVWVDRIAGVCGHWNPQQGRIDSTYDGPLMATSGGGEPRAPAICPPDAAVTAGYYYLVNQNGSQVAERIKLVCHRLTSDHNETVEQPTIYDVGGARDDDHLIGESEALMGPQGSDVLLCLDRNGQVATGYQANVAQFVGQIVLHCGDWPAPAIHLSRLGHAGLGVAAPEPTQVTQSPADLARERRRIGAGPDFSRATSSPGLASQSRLGAGASGASSANASPPAVGAGFDDRLAAATADAMPQAAGGWQTSEGAMKLKQIGDSLEAAYGGDNGSVHGQLHGRALYGVWAEASSSHRCPSAQYNSAYWGRVEWVFSPDGSSFEGRWSYCDGPMSSGWSGHRN